MPLTPTEARALVTAKGTKFATVTFIKKDGTERAINGLFSPSSKILGTGRPTPAHIIPIWSPRDGWRSFREDSVVEIR
jgi:hypothetical protein